MARQFKTGDFVVYSKQKVSKSPGPRAVEVTPATKGDTYAYVVEKYWIVSAVNDDGTLTLRTRRGKEHVILPDDPMLRHLTWWERLWHSGRYRMLHSESGGSTEVGGSTEAE